MVDLDVALTFACNLAKDAGKIAREYSNPEIAIDPKADNSPVTQADIAINKLVIERCQAKYPEIGIMGEEESAAGKSDWLWVCDPIDGTLPYVLGMSASTFCLALVRDGQPVIGVVYDFMSDRLFAAKQGGPALLNGKPFNQSKNPMKLVELELFGAAPHSVGDLHKDLLKDMWQAINLASYAYTTTLVATGRIAGAIYTGDKPWDVAAASLIAAAAGCTVTDLDGEDQRYDGPIKGALIAHPQYTVELLARLRKARAEK